MKHLKSFNQVFEELAAPSAGSLISWTSPSEVAPRFESWTRKAIVQIIGEKVLAKIKKSSAQYGGPDVESAINDLFKDLSGNWISAAFAEINAGSFNSKGSLQILQDTILARVKSTLASINWAKRKLIGAAMITEFGNREKYIATFKQIYPDGDPRAAKYPFNPFTLKSTIREMYESVFMGITDLNLKRNLPKNQNDAFLDSLYKVQDSFRDKLRKINFEAKTQLTKPKADASIYIPFFEKLMGTVWDSI